MKRRRAFAWLGVIALSASFVFGVNAPSDIVSHDASPSCATLLESSSTATGPSNAMNILNPKDLAPPAVHGPGITNIAIANIQQVTYGNARVSEMSDGQVYVSDVYASQTQVAPGQPHVSSVQPQPPVPATAPAPVGPYMESTITFWGHTITTKVPVSNAGVGVSPVTNQKISSNEVPPGVLQTKSATYNTPMSSALVPAGEPAGPPTVQASNPQGSLSTPQAQSNTLNTMSNRLMSNTVFSSLTGTAISAQVLESSALHPVVSASLPVTPVSIPKGPSETMGGASNNPPMVSTTLTFWGHTVTTAWPLESSALHPAVSPSLPVTFTPKGTSETFSGASNFRTMLSTTMTFWGMTITTAWPLESSDMQSATPTKGGNSNTSNLPAGTHPTASATHLPRFNTPESGSKMTSSLINSPFSGSNNPTVKSSRPQPFKNITEPSLSTRHTAVPASTGPTVPRTSAISVTSLGPVCGTRTMTDSTVGTDDMASGTLWCTPPCNLVIPNYPLKTPSVITLSPLTTTITHQVASGSSGTSNVVIITTITPKPLTMSTASFMAQPITDCNQTSGAFVPRAVFVPSPSPWQTSITGGPVISSNIVIPPYQPPASTCSSYQDCPLPPLAIVVCGSGQCGGGGGGGGCGLLCGNGCPFPSILSFLCHPWNLDFPKPPCIGPFCNPFSLCPFPVFGCWIPFPPSIDPNLPTNNKNGPDPNPPDSNPEESAASTSGTITSSKSCTSRSTVTDIVVSCFTADSTQYCENATSVTVTGCDVTPTSSTKYLACPSLDPNEPQGDSSMPASVSSSLWSWLTSNASFPTSTRFSSTTAGFPAQSFLDNLWSVASNAPMPTHTTTYSNGPVTAGQTVRPGIPPCFMCAAALEDAPCARTDIECMEHACKTDRDCLNCPLANNCNFHQRMFDPLSLSLR